MSLPAGAPQGKCLLWLRRVALYRQRTIVLCQLVIRELPRNLRFKVLGKIAGLPVISR